MITVDITSDIDEAMKDVAKFFNRQIPYATMLSINATVFDVQRVMRKEITEATPRNKALPTAMTKIIPDEKSGIGGRFTTQNFLKTKHSVVIGPALSKNGFLAGEGFAERQVTGATKVPKTSAIAKPVLGPGLKRNANGAIPASKRAKNLRNNEKFFKTEGKFGTEVIYEKMGADGGRLRLRHSLLTAAKGTRTLAAVYPAAFAEVDRSFPGHFETAMNRAIATSRFSL